MRMFFSDVLQFALDLLEHWVAFATGSSLAMIAGAWEHWRGRAISWRLYIVAFLAFGFVAASFQTWRQERFESVHFRDSSIAQQLQKYYVEAEQYRRAMLEAQRAPDQEFDAVKKEADAWAQDMGHWIIDRMGWAAYTRLIKLPEEKAKLSGRGDWEQSLFTFTTIRDNLEKLVENPASPVWAIASGIGGKADIAHLGGHVAI